MQAAGKDIHHTGYLAQTRDTSVRYIGHMHLAEKGQHMMLAERVEINILDHHHLTIIFLKQGRTQNGLGILVIALGEKLHGLAYAVRRFLQSLARRILSYLAQQCLYVLGDACRLGLIRIELL